MLDWTGERFVPWANEAAVAYEHLHRYIWASSFVEKKRVLDLASGEGYGAELLARRASFVCGVDIDEAAVVHASNKYGRANLEFLTGSLTAVPISDDHSFDVITCFEAIEHIEQHDDLMREVKRLLKADGLFIVSTPNKEAYKAGAEKNPFHVREFSFEEFNALLTRYFPHVRYLGQRVHPGSSMWPIGAPDGTAIQEFLVERSEDRFQALSEGARTPIYFVAIASEGNVADFRGSVLTDCSDELVNQKDRATARLLAELRQRDEAMGWLQHCKEDLEGKLASRDEALAVRTRQVEELGAQLESIRGSVVLRFLRKLWSVAGK